ncbi:MAG: hypothetical protein ACRDP8_16360, partial [Actinopolymorphaceae bacterium]
NDLDGGGPDVVVGLPSYDLPSKPDAGAIAVFSNVAGPGEPNPSPPAARTILTADDFPGLTSQVGARFGASPVLWNDGPDDADHCADLLVGSPGQNVAGQAGAGRAYLLHGSDQGLDGVLNTYDEAGLDGTGGPQAGAHFSAAIAAETSSMIAIGAPGRDIGDATDAGRVVRLDYLLSDQPPIVSVVQQGGLGADNPEDGDRFGEVVHLFGTGDGPVLIVGVPHEDVGTKVDAGAVAAQPPNGPLSVVTQDSPGAGGSAESGDRYGASIDSYSTFVVDHPVCMVAVGVPGEDLGGAANAGMVSYAAVDLFLPEEPVAPIRGLALTISQDSGGVPGGVEAGDQFGSVVATGEFGAERLHLVASSPTEDLGTIRDAGMVTMTRIDPQTGTTLPGAQPGSWTQGSAGVAGTPETGDRFGSGVTGAQLSQPVDDEDPNWAVLLVSVAGENVGNASDAGMAYLGVPAGQGSVGLSPPTPQSGAGSGMAGMHMLLG